MILSEGPSSSLMVPSSGACSQSRRISRCPRLLQCDTTWIARLGQRPTASESGQPEVGRTLNISVCCLTYHQREATSRSCEPGTDSKEAAQGLGTVPVARRYLLCIASTCFWDSLTVDLEICLGANRGVADILCVARWGDLLCRHIGNVGCL